MNTGTHVQVIRGPLAGSVGVVAEQHAKVIGVRLPSSTPFFTEIVGLARSDIQPLDKLADVPEAWL